MGDLGVVALFLRNPPMKGLWYSHKLDQFCICDRRENEFILWLSDYWSPKSFIFFTWYIQFTMQLEYIGTFD